MYFFFFFSITHNVNHGLVTALSFFSILACNWRWPWCWNRIDVKIGILQNCGNTVAKSYNKGPGKLYRWQNFMLSTFSCFQLSASHTWNSLASGFGLLALGFRLAFKLPTFFSLKIKIKTRPKSKSWRLFLFYFI